MYMKIAANESCLPHYRMGDPCQSTGWKHAISMQEQQNIATCLGRTREQLLATPPTVDNTEAPNRRAMVTVSSSLPPSATITSCAVSSRASASSNAPMREASFSVGMMTEITASILRSQKERGL